jgi:hypothetical protein
VFSMRISDHQKEEGEGKEDASKQKTNNKSVVEVRV